MPQLANTSVVFATSLTSGADIAPYFKAGTLGVIAKPLQPLQLTGQLNALWHCREAALH